MTCARGNGLGPCGGTVSRTGAYCYNCWPGRASAARRAVRWRADRQYSVCNPRGIRAGGAFGRVFDPGDTARRRRANPPRRKTGRCGRGDGPAGERPAQIARFVSLVGLAIGLVAAVMLLGDFGSGLGFFIAVAVGAVLFLVAAVRT